jgi:hypothetical protein
MIQTGEFQMIFDSPYMLDVETFFDLSDVRRNSSAADWITTEYDRTAGLCDRTPEEFTRR